MCTQCNQIYSATLAGFVICLVPFLFVCTWFCIARLFSFIFSSFEYVCALFCSTFHFKLKWRNWKLWHCHSVIMLFCSSILYISLANTVVANAVCARSFLSCAVDVVFVLTSYSFRCCGCRFRFRCWLANSSKSWSVNSELHPLFHGDGTIMLKFKHEFAYFIPYVWLDCLNFFREKEREKNISYSKLTFFIAFHTFFSFSFFLVYIDRIQIATTTVIIKRRWAFWCRANVHTRMWMYYACVCV